LEIHILVLLLAIAVIVSLIQIQYMSRNKYTQFFHY